MTSRSGGWPTALVYSDRLVSRLPSAVIRWAIAWASDGFGLRHVGPGHLADPEPVARRFQLLAQDLLVVAGDFEQGLVAHDVEKGGDDGLEDGRSRSTGSAPARPARC